jgi:hypothetical protein
MLAGDASGMAASQAGSVSRLGEASAGTRTEREH